MGKESKMFNASNQMRFCYQLADRLSDSVEEWVNAGCPDWACGKTLISNGASKTQIKQDIMRLRRELMKLSKVVE